MRSLAEGLAAIQRTLGGELQPDAGGNRLRIRGAEMRLRRARGGVTVELHRDGRLWSLIPTDAGIRDVLAAARGLLGG